MDVPYPHNVQGKEGGNITFVAFFVLWAMILAAATLGFAYVGVFGVINLAGVRLGAPTATFTDLVPSHPVAYVAIDLEHLTAEERGSIAAFLPALYGVDDGNVAIFGLRDDDGLLHWAILLHTTKPFQDAIKMAFHPFGDDVLLAADPWMTERIATASRLDDVFATDDKAMAALRRLAGLSPISGYVDIPRLTDALPDIVAWLPEGVTAGFAVRKNAQRTLGFAAPVSVIAAKNGFFGLALPLPAQTVPRTFDTPLKKIVETQGIASSPEILAALFHPIETKRAAIGSALEGNESPTSALTPFFNKPFHYATVTTADGKESIAHFDGMSAKEALKAVKNYLSGALPVRVPRRLPDGQTLEEYLITDWPAFSGEKNVGPTASYHYDENGIHIAISGDETGASLATSADAAVETIPLTDTLRTRLHEACRRFLGDNSTVVDLSTLMNTFYAQLNLGQLQQRTSLNGLFTSVDNSVLFCE